MEHIRFGNVAALLALCAATVVASYGQTFTTLANFDGTNGAYPYFETLVQGRDGDLYGTTENGGNVLYGTVFKIATDGHLTQLHRFRGTDGFHPYAGLALTNAGDFYGTTKQGGKHGYGSIFKITPGGTLTTVYNFCSKAHCADGGAPVEALLQGSDGNLYGATGSGGSGYGGTLFKLTPSGTLTTLYSFPYPGGPSALIEATDGSFCGTTEAGGDFEGGSVFKLTPSGELTTLYSFCYQATCIDGASPYGALVQGADGNFYGTTNIGPGGFNGGGTVFQMTPDGTLTTLYNFSCSEGGCSPTAGLVLGTDGNLYGTAEQGGATFGGTIFQITPSGTLTTLHSFCAQSNCADGGYPYGGLVQATDGDFYGTTSEGGANNDGTVFKLAMGLAPFVKTVPTAGKAGMAVTVLGTDLTGATSVTFNGTPAVFTVVKASEIATTVPAGAGTGVVTVVTPGGTLTSNVAFSMPQ
jgi:uncharacterized repeat protein (TIGR03803 family)